MATDRRMDDIVIGLKFPLRGEGGYQVQLGAWRTEHGILLIELLRKQDEEQMLKET